MARQFKAAGSKGSGRGHQALQITCTASLLYLAAALGGSRDLSVAEHYEGPAYLKNVHKWKTLEGKRRYIEVLEKGGPREQLPPKQIAPGKPPGPDALTEAQRSAMHKTQRCAGMQGSACTSWWAQTSIPLRPPPQGNKECAGNCNNVGVCNHDIGECLCPAGFGGKDCTEKVRRPCSYRLRESRDPPGVQIDEPGVFTVDGWSAARCAGECDDVFGLCYCGYNSTYSRIPAPAGSPWGTPPIRAGLPLKTPCQPKTDPNGKEIRFGHMDYQTLYGPQGWCNAPEVSTVCPCALESMQGHTCQRPAEAWCPNQCNLRGQCILGWCKCDNGWYGHACDKMKAGTEYTRVDDVKIGKFSGVWREPPHAHQPLTPSMHRKRPFIYVYDLPSEYNTRMIQLKHHRDSCNWRRFNDFNGTDLGTGVYMVETYLHEAMLTTTHRTLDPEEADFFYVPIYYTCFAWPILGWTDGPWFGPVPDPNLRPLQAAHMYLGAKRWLEQAYPYWNRSQGKDHIFLTTNDEGACFMPSEIYNTAIFFTHWGRTDLDHESGTAYPADNYTKPIGDGWERHHPGDWRDMYKGHACYTPGKDLVIPSFKAPDHFKSSPLLGAKPLQRDILMYFKGDCGVFARLWWYSRGIRQTLFRYALEDNWWREYKIVVVHSGQLQDNYGESLARSKFCLVAPGDGWSARAEDAILHGCLPVVIQDEVEQSFHGFVDWNEFGVRIPQANMSNLPQILMAYSDEQIARMQAALAKVWHRFAYATGPWHRKAMPNTYNAQPYDNDREHWSEHVFAPLHRYPVMNDAFHTIMQWLYGRINTDKGGPLEGTPAAHGQRTSQ